ncbi:hypothetical protein E5D88_01145 [Helicobacter pylori]|nr:hypothetical protein E5D88_01145 [Helicobacter pylori]
MKNFKPPKQKTQTPLAFVMNAAKLRSYLGQRSYAFKGMMRGANALEIKLCKNPND